jgi:hypothetical protein
MEEMENYCRDGNCGVYGLATDTIFFLVVERRVENVLFLNEAGSLLNEMNTH